MPVPGESSRDPATDEVTHRTPGAPVGGAAHVETHSAALFFFGDRVYKVKKPVDLGFLDFTTVEARALACRREVDLNRRLAPDVYLGVSELRDPDGSVCDHLVTMRRMPEDRRLARCLERGEDVSDGLRQIARDIASLHAAGGTSELVRVGSRDVVREHWTDGFAQLAPLVGGSLDAAVEHEIETLALRYLAGRDPLFAERVAGGHVRDGHGDLQAEDIFVLSDGPRILDCLEFDDELRWGDVLLDIGFLAMDLEHLGHPDAATQLLASYREFSGEVWPASLAHHYLAYRAHVRAKVGAIRAAQRGEPSAEVDTLQKLCLRHLRDGRIRLVLVGGLPGTGKSTAAAALGEEVGAVVLRTDEVRREAGAGDRYSAAGIDATYEELLRRAERLLCRGEQVILDATWSDEVHRDLARRVAAGADADVVEICCIVTPEVGRARIERRLAEGRDASEATIEVAGSMALRFAPWPQSATVDTDREVAEIVRDSRYIGGWTSSG